MTDPDQRRTAMQVQYITTEQGKQVGVLLDMAAYHRLLGTAVDDPDLLVALSQEELEALATSKLAPELQAQLDELLQAQQERPLSAEEEAQLDRLLAQVDQLTILKSRARYTLQAEQRP
jgi:hypothetical protein